MGFPLMVQAIRLSMAAIEPRLEQAASTLARALAGVFHRYLAFVAAGHHRRHGAGFRPGAGRIRRHHYLRRQYPRGNPHVAPGVFHLDANPRGDDAAYRLVWLSMAVAFGALMASDLLGRRSKRLLGE